MIRRQACRVLEGENIQSGGNNGDESPRQE